LSAEISDGGSWHNRRRRHIRKVISR